MSVEFRPRKIGEYLDIVRKRKWLILLPTIAIGLAIAYVVYRLPDLYESTTLIVVKPSTLPNSVVPTITEETLTRQLTSISQVVTSRSSLEPLMEKYDLYKEERRRGEPMELLIDSDAEADQGRGEHQPQRHYQRLQHHLSRPRPQNRRRPSPVN